MKNLLKILSVFALFFIVSCNTDDNELIYEGDPYGYFLEKIVYLQGPDGFSDYDVKVGTLTAVSANTEYKLERIGGNAVEGTHFDFINSTVVIPAGSNVGSFKVRVYGADLDQVIPKNATFKLVSTTVPTTNYNQDVTLSFTYGCPSDLAGTYDFSTTNAFTPDGGGKFEAGPLTGTVKFTQISNGIYAIDDSSFGAYAPFYNVKSTGVKFKNLCGKLSFTDSNQYGDSFTISNVVVNGSSLTFNWMTTFNEYGTTTLTRTDGTNWPSNLH